jgi:hypothetical protein
MHGLHYASEGDSGGSAGGLRLLSSSLSIRDAALCTILLHAHCLRNWLAHSYQAIRLKKVLIHKVCSVVNTNNQMHLGVKNQQSGQNQAILFLGKVN